MSSMEELKIVRLYRAYNTVIQMCMDRGYTVRHPSAVAQSIHDPRVYSDEEGLDYNWFLDHFVVQQAASANAAELAEEETGGDDTPHEKRLSPMRGAMRLVCGAAVGQTPHSGGSLKNSGGEKGKVMLVYFSASPVLSMSEVQEYREKALQKQASCMIIVSAGKIQPAIRRGTRELSGRFRPGTTEEVMSIQLFEEDELSCNIARHETVPPHVLLSPSEAQAFLQQRRIALSQLPRILYEDPMVAYLGLARGSVVKIERDSKESGPYEMYRQVI